MLGAQGIRATGFKRAQGNAHCAKFESHTHRVTFETNAIRMTSSVQAHCVLYSAVPFLLGLLRAQHGLVTFPSTESHFPFNEEFFVTMPVKQTS